MIRAGGSSLASCGPASRGQNGLTTARKLLIPHSTMGGFGHFSILQNPPSASSERNEVLDFQPRGRSSLVTIASIAGEG